MCVPTCCRYPGTSSAAYPPPPRCPYTSLKQFYWIDLASVLPALLLGVQPHHAVLDMCAAPGGKSLVLAMQLLLGSSSTVGQLPAGQHCAGAAAAAAVGERDRQPEEPADIAAMPQQAMTGSSLTADILASLSIGQPEGSASCSDEGQVALLPGEGQHQPPSPQQQQSIDAADAAPGNGVHTPNAPDVSNQVNDAANSSSGSSSCAAGYWPDINSTETAGKKGAGSSGGGRLVCNELDATRRSRLSGLLADYIPGSLRRHVRFSGHDAAKHWSR